MKKVIISTLPMVFCSTMLFASKIDGTWKGVLTSNQGDFNIVVTYKVEGDKVTGSIGPDKKELRNGKISGNEFGYDYDYQGYTVTHKCELVGEEIKVKWSFDMMAEGEFVLKKE